MYSWYGFSNVVYVVVRGMLQQAALTAYWIVKTDFHVALMTYTLSRLTNGLMFANSKKHVFKFSLATTFIGGGQILQLGCHQYSLMSDLSFARGDFPVACRTSTALLRRRFSKGSHSCNTIDLRFLCALCQDHLSSYHT